MVNGTSRMRASVCASSVLPEPVGPTSRMFDLAISTSLFFCAVRQPLVVVVHRDRQHLLGVVLADHVVVQHLADLARRRHAVARLHQVRLVLLADDVHAQLDAFIADEHGRAGDELAHLVLRLAAERAVQGVLRIAGLAHAHSCPAIPGPADRIYATRPSTTRRPGQAPARLMPAQPKRQRSCQHLPAASADTAPAVGPSGSGARLRLVVARPAPGGSPPPRPPGRNPRLPRPTCSCRAPACARSPRSAGRCGVT